jgi:hypothetical protein
MGVLKQALGDSGAGHTIDFAGRKLTFKPMTLVRQDAFEDWLEEEADKAAVKTAARRRKQARELRRHIEELERQLDADGDKLSNDQQTELAAQMDDLEAEARALELEARQQTSELNDKIARGYFGYLCDVAQASLSTFAGSTRQMFLMLQPHHKDITIEQAQAWYAAPENRPALNDAMRLAEAVERPQPAGAEKTNTATAETTTESSRSPDT